MALTAKQKRRVARGKAAQDAHNAGMGDGYYAAKGEEVERLSDTLTDLRHFADKSGLDWDDVLRRAMVNYVAERVRA